MLEQPVIGRKRAGGGVGGGGVSLGWGGCGKGITDLNFSSDLNFILVDRRKNI